jgi:tryptophanyl-tRNA synthetase
MKENLLTGDRPTGKLHLGHYVGSLENRVAMQNSEKYNPFIFIADLQALTDNARNPEKIRTNLIEVALDYLAIGLDPNKSTIFVQSQIPELAELTMYYMNLVTVARLQRNPTIKDEIKQRGFQKSIPAGFLTYPVSQTADITAFDAKYVPVGEDQLPIIEQTREIVRTFNSIYGDALVEPEGLLPDKKSCRRLPGTDGQGKMSKSVGNCIYLSDSADTIREKVMNMFTDPKHLKVSDKGNTKNNPIFIYLDVFCKDRKKFEEMKSHYERGGLGDIAVKNYLNEVLQELLKPIRERRENAAKNIPAVYDMLFQGSIKAREVAANTLLRVRKAVGVEYFTDAKLINKTVNV